jgi:hypothetical protein
MNGDPEAFGYRTEVRAVDPSYGRPPAYSGGNARQELDDVPDGGEVALRTIDVRVRTESSGSGRDQTRRHFEVTYRVSYDERAVVAKTVSEKGSARNKSDATLAALSLAAAVARADRAVRSFLDRDGLDFELRSVGDLVDAARSEATDVLVSDVETIVDADERADQQRREAAGD